MIYDISCMIYHIAYFIHRISHEEGSRGEDRDGRREWRGGGKEGLFWERRHRPSGPRTSRAVRSSALVATIVTSRARAVVSPVVTCLDGVARTAPSVSTRRPPRDTPPVQPSKLVTMRASITTAVTSAPSRTHAPSEHRRRPILPLKSRHRACVNHAAARPTAAAFPPAARARESDERTHPAMSGSPG